MEDYLEELLAQSDIDYSDDETLIDDYSDM